MRYTKSKRKYITKRSHGYDNILASELKQETNSPLLIILKKYFIDWINESKIPEFLMTGRMILISKENNDSPTLENIRPITILPAVVKFFEKKYYII